MPKTSPSLEAAGLGHIGAKVRALLDRQAHDRHEIEWRDAKIEKLTFEMAQLRRVKFGKKSEQLDAEQKALFDEAVDADLAALEAQLAELMAAKRKETEPAPERPKRAVLPAHLPRVERHHEPSDTTCACGCQMTRIGEDVSEKLDYTPGSFTVERHVRGKWACAKCRTLTQAPVPAEIIDKGLPTSGLLAHVLVAKHSDHLPLYRQEAIFERAGLAIPRSTLAAWVGVCGIRLQPLVDAMKADLLRMPVLHADETPVAMLAPGTGKTHRAYLWAYASGAFEDMRAVVYDFTESRSGQHPRTFLGHGIERSWKGSLVCDDYGRLPGAVHRRRYHRGGLHGPRAPQVRGAALGQQEHLGGHRHRAHRAALRHRAGSEGPASRGSLARTTNARWGRSRRQMHKWLLEFRPKVPDGSATARAMGLQPEPLGGSHALPRRPGLAHRQQLRRAANQAMGHRTQELALRGDTARRAAGGCHHELDP